MKYYNSDDFFEGCLIAILAIVFRIIMLFVFAVPAMYLWNWLMPLIFNLPTVNFWQTVGFMLLLNLMIPNNVVTTTKN